MENFLSLSEKNKRIAAEQCIKLLGQKNPKSVVLEDNGLYTHINTRGIKRTMLVCKTFAEYQEEQRLKPKAKYHKCVGYYVLYW